MSTYDEICLTLAKMANKYAQNVIFWREEHRNVLRKFIQVIEMCQQLKAAHKKKSRSFERRDIRKRKRQRPTIEAPPAPLRLRHADEHAYERFLGMSEEHFLQILELVREDIRKADTNVHNTILPQEQLSVTLRYLATGETYKSLGTRHKLSHAYLVYCIPRVCNAIWMNMKDHYLKLPNSPEQWKIISQQFENIYKYPLCLGALNEHLINYASSVNDAFSLVLLTLSDANYKFLYIDVGQNDKQAAESEVLKNSSLQAALDNGGNHFPSDESIGNFKVLPYHIVGGRAFPLQKHLMTPYPNTPKVTYRRVYNERLARPRQVVVRTFRIMLARFRVLQKSIGIRSAKNVELVTRACCVLHNFLMENAPQYAEVGNTEKLSSVKLAKRKITSNQYTAFDDIRRKFMEYFNEEGALDPIEI